MTDEVLPRLLSGKGAQFASWAFCTSLHRSNKDEFVQLKKKLWQFKQMTHHSYHNAERSLLFFTSVKQIMFPLGNTSPQYWMEGWDMGRDTTQYVLVQIWTKGLTLFNI